jgi:hypothetical protein
MLRRSRTSSVSIQRSPEEVLSFLAEVESWPRWAVLTVRRVRRQGEGWVVEGVEGELPLAVVSRPELGLFDYELGGWSVAMRVLPSGDGSEVVATFFQPEGLEEREFEQAVNVRERELKALKVVLSRTG